MGMRINTGSGIDPKMVEKLIELEKMPVKKIEERQQKLVEEKELFDKLSALVKDLGSQAEKLRSPMDFRRLKLESSHPDIIDGKVDNTALPGSYELELRSLAKTPKLLAGAYPDPDETPVGFGYLTIENDEGESFEIEILPGGTTLKDVAAQINSGNFGCRAVILNTKENLENKDADTFRLLVISEKSGKPAKLYIDPDTTWLEFHEQVTGRNLELLFEDVPVYDDDNSIEALLPGVVLEGKRAEPGTKINLNITYDVEATTEEIKGWLDSYNKVNEFIEEQFVIDPKTNKAGILSKDNNIRGIRRALRSSIDVSFNEPGAKYTNFAQIGITTDSKTGALKLDEAQLSKALAEDYIGVSKLFVGSVDLPGATTRMSDTVRGMTRGTGGIITSRDREFKNLMRNFDNEISRAERFAEKRSESIKRRFSALESTLSGLNAQGAAMQARLGGGGG